YLRLWDVASANRVDYFVGISRAVQARIAKYYRRSSEVVSPPVEVSRFSPSAPALSSDFPLTSLETGGIERTWSDWPGRLCASWAGGRTWRWQTPSRTAAPFSFPARRTSASPRS